MGEREREKKKEERDKERKRERESSSVLKNYQPGRSIISSHGQIMG